MATAPTAHAAVAAIRERMPLVPEVKLHKLLYYAQGHHLAAFEEPLFTESVKAWDMGPVVEAVWQQERDGVTVAEPADLDEARLNTIGYVLSRYGGMSGSDLARLSHGETPWLEADTRRRPQRSVRIPNESIRRYFLAQAGDEASLDPPVDQDALDAVLEGAHQRRGDPVRPDTEQRLRSRLAELAE